MACICAQMRCNTAAPYYLSDVVYEALALLGQVSMLPASKLFDLLQCIGDELSCWLVLRGAGLGHSAVARLPGTALLQTNNWPDNET